MDARDHTLIAALTLLAAACADPAAGEPRFAQPTELKAPVAGSRALAPERRALAALPRDALRRSLDGLSKERGVDGVVKLHLQGRFQHATVGVTENGTTRTSCLDGHAPESVQDPR